MKHCLLFTLITFIYSNKIDAQENEFYFNSGGELIFSWADVENNGKHGNSIVRMSAFFHIQSLANYDFNKHLGAFSGLAIRNIGFIYDDPVNPEIRKKYRTYNLGIPVGVKLGNLDRRFIYLGYELELPFSYKEKTFVNEEKKDKFTVFFSDRTPNVYHSIFIGVNGLSGFSIKFKYYFTDFFDENFTLVENGIASQPFVNFKANIIYLSLSFSLFKNNNFYYDDVFSIN